MKMRTGKVTKFKVVVKEKDSFGRLLAAPRKMIRITQGKNSVLIDADNMSTEFMADMDKYQGQMEETLITGIIAGKVDEINS